MSRWFRVYDTMVDDPKVQLLAPEVFKGLVNLWCLACRNGGELPPLNDIAFSLRTTPAKVQQLIAELIVLELIDRDAATGIIQPHNWESRQYQSDVSNDRVKRHRQRRRNGDGNVTPTVTPDVTATPPDTETEPEKNLSHPSDARPSAKSDDAEAAVKSFNAVAELAGWPKVQRVSPFRRRAVLARLRDAGGLDGWHAAMTRAAASSFLCGGSKDGWTADFDFFCQAKSFTKLMEGSYDDHAPNGTAGGNHREAPGDTLLRAVAEWAAPGNGEGEREADPDGGEGDPPRRASGDPGPTVELAAGEYRRAH